MKVDATSCLANTPTQAESLRHSLKQALRTLESPAAHLSMLVAANVAATSIVSFRILQDLANSRSKPTYYVRQPC